MNISSQIRQLSSDIPIGRSQYFDCVRCGRKKKLGITKQTDGLIYQCFSASCPLKGHLYYAKTKEAVSDILNKRTITPRKFVLPEHFVNGFVSDDGVKLAVKYDLFEGYQQGRYRTAYDPRLNRQVFYHLDATGKIVGAMGRSLDGTPPKAHIYENSEKSLFIVGDSKIGVMTEDLFSAIMVSNVGYTGIGLSGTSFNIDYLNQVESFDKIIIALDKDAGAKSFKLRKFLQMFVKDVRILLLEKDLKDMTREQVKQLIEGVL